MVLWKERGAKDMLKQERPLPVSSRWIILARQRLGWTQKELAVALGVSKFTISRWEGGHRAPPPYLRLSIGWLLLEGGFREDDLVALEEISVRFDSLGTRQPEPLLASDISDEVLDEILAEEPSQGSE